MAKLIFTYGTMGSAKTANALMKNHELKEQGKSVLFLKSKTDTRDGSSIIKSRTGMMAEVVLFSDEENLKLKLVNNRFDAIIVDEAHFCKAHHVEELKDIASYYDIPVYTYGLKTNFQTKLFEGSQRLMELADDIRALEMTCVKCTNQAEINARFDANGRLITKGSIVDIGGNEKYKPLCYKCYIKEMYKARQMEHKVNKNIQDQGGEQSQDKELDYR
ncbi:MAG: thymidine kinase [Clostridia bacterium]|nr:thymidine kinase [Clostridia bacterium]